MKTGIFKLDDSKNPGLAQVELIKKLPHTVLGYNIWRVRVLEIIKPSFNKCKIGVLKDVSERFLEIKI